MDNWINMIKHGGKVTVLLSQITFYGTSDASLENKISDHKADDLPQDKTRLLRTFQGCEVKIHPKVTVWNHKALPSHDEQWSWWTDFSIYTSHPW